MRRVISIIVVIGLCCGCTAPVRPARGTGPPAAEAVEPPRGNPQRIVSLKPNITEILFALGAGDRVVGVTTWCKYPPGATTLPKVADYLRPFPERIAAVHPDLIIGSQENSDPQMAATLRPLGAPVYYFPFRTIKETAQSVREIGALVGAKATGETLAQTIAKLSAPQPSPLPPEADYRKGEGATAVAIVGYRPLVAVGGGTFLSDIIRAAGLRNILSDGSLPYPQLSLERLLALDPDVILDMTMGTEVSSDFWKQLPRLRAVQEGHVIPLSMDDLHAGPRLPSAVARLKAQSGAMH